MIKLFKKIDDDDEEKKFFSNFELPLNNEIINIADKELNLFKNFLNHLLKMNQSVLTNKISFAENLAFRLLGTIDWNHANFNELKKFIDPLLNTKHLNLNDMIFKENGQYLHLKQSEVHEAIHEWSNLRLELNKKLISNQKLFNLSSLEDKKSKVSKEKANLIDLPDLFSKSNADNRIKELLILYIIAKWSKDDSSLKFSTFFHYGIPRARLRSSNLKENNSSILSVKQDFSFASTFTSSSQSDLSQESLPISPPVSSSSKLEDSITSNSFQSQKSGIRYYCRNDNIVKKNPKIQTKIQKQNDSGINSINESKDSYTQNNDFNKESNNVRTDLKMVKGGVLVKGANLYFPSYNKK